MRRCLPWFLSAAVLAGSFVGTGVQASDWARFRGPNGNGVSQDTKTMPVTWSATEHLAWKVPLPGPGSSSPIIVGDKVFVTCWSGYGESRSGSPGKQENLKRHLVCLDRKTGKTIWDSTVDPYLPEDNYSGMFAEHGYATHTPVSDGERVYVFFGKTGALAFDMDGKQLWKTPLGTGSGAMGWGSSSSPVLYKDYVIITAAAESQTIYALDKKTGKEVWKAQADGLASTWGTPILVKVDENRTDLVLSVPYEIWGFNPDTGKLRWYCEGLNNRSVCASVVTDGTLIYASGDEGSGSMAIMPGGLKDISQTHVAWTGRDSARICTPVIADGKMYFVANRVATCIEATTGKRLYQGRLGGGTGGGGNAGAAAPAPVESEPPRGAGGPGGAGGFGGRGGGGGRGGQDYSSGVVADGKLYYVARNGTTYVIKLGEKFELLATNRVTEETEDFSSTPAVSDGALFIRSSKHLYCISSDGK